MLLPVLAVTICLPPNVPTLTDEPNTHNLEATLQWTSYADTHWGTSEGDYIFFSGNLIYQQVFLGAANLITNAAYNARDLNLEKTVSGSPRGLGRRAYGFRVLPILTP